MIVRKGYFKRISWGAVFAGLVIALVIQMLLSLLGLAIGFGSIDPQSEINPFSGLGTGALIWWVVSMLISLFVGGLAAGRLSGIQAAFDRVLHGLLTFSLYSLITFYLLTTAIGGIISGVGSIVGQTLSMAGKGVAAVAPEFSNLIEDQMDKSGVNLENIKQEAEQILRQTGKEDLQPDNLKNRADKMSDKVKQAAGNSAQNPQSIDNSSENLVDRLLSQGKEVVNAADRDAAVNVVMKRTGKSRKESEQIVDNWIASYHQAKEKFDTLKVKAEEQARETGDAIASAASKASLFAFIGLIIGAAASGAGAGVGKPKYREIEVEETRSYTNT